jgi:hypothetical protein
MGEMNLECPREGLEVSVALDLLRERGYGMSCRFEHVHATTGAQELHICLLACLDEAIQQSLQYVLSQGC